MKKIKLLICALGLSAQIGMAQELALVTKVNASGFTMPEYVRVETCEVFQNRVVITRRFGGFDEKSFTSTETLRVQLSRNIRNIVALAAKEKLVETENYMCDAPSTEIHSSHAGRKLVLFSSGGCGGSRLERQEGASRMLVDLVGKYCPTTHDYGVGITHLDF